MELAAEAVDGLPEWVHDAMDNVEVFVEDLPPSDQPGLLGLYHGVPLSKRGSTTPARFPTTSRSIARRSNASRAGARSGCAAIIAHTVAHEVAHHFGISDDRLREIGAY